MRILVLLALCYAGFAAESAPPLAPAPEAPKGPALSADDLQNLIACARLKLPDLTADQIAVMAVAIKHAEEDMKAMREATATQPSPEAEK